jgi:CheY-like chemotaxis protein
MSDEKILIIDDSNELLALLESILPYSGYQTIGATTGEEGLGLALDLKPDVILVDLELPDTTGLKFLEEMNRHQLAIPTIMMTGYGSEGVAARALKLGALGYLIKPFTTDEVLSSVDRALTVKRLRREKAQLAALVDAYGRDFKLLSALGRALVTGLDLNRFFQRVVEAASYATRAERCLLMLSDQGTPLLQVAAAWGKATPTGCRCSPQAGDDRLRPVLQKGTSVCLHTPAGAEIILQTGDAARAVLQIPLRMRDRVGGLLSVDRQSAELAFGKHDEQILAILADFAVLALEKQAQAQGWDAMVQPPLGDPFEPTDL